MFKTFAPIHTIHYQSEEQSTSVFAQEEAFLILSNDIETQLLATHCLPPLKNIDIYCITLMKTTLDAGSRIWGKLFFFFLYFFFFLVAPQLGLAEQFH